MMVVITTKSLVTTYVGKLHEHTMVVICQCSTKLCCISYVSLVSLLFIAGTLLYFLINNFFEMSNQLRNDILIVYIYLFCLREH